MKIVINSCFGGYGLSEAAYQELGLKWDGYGSPNIARNDPRLVTCVEKLGEAANGEYAKLRVIEIPDNVKWEIDEYDGMERVYEAHRSWS